jgi:hypothetical protein
MRELAPIGVSAYSRINHLRQTISSLQQNNLAKESELYIFSDAPRNGDEEKVAEVREYLHTISGFRQIHIFERETNSRVANNRGGIKQLLDKYGKVIWLEEDIVTAPGFLVFMNEALDFYQDDERILSISGYCPPIEIPHEYQKDIFLLIGLSGWGLATWKEKFDPFGFDLQKHGIDDFFKNTDDELKFSKCGEDFFILLLREYNGEIDALDVKATYYEFRYNMYTLYPKKSLVQNIGCDGSGWHCGKTNRFFVNELWNKQDNFMFENNISINEKILKVYSRYRSGSMNYVDLFLRLAHRIKDNGINEVIVYGAGNVGRYLAKIFILKGIRVNCFVDKNELLWGKFIGEAEIKSLNEVSVGDIDIYVIASFAFAKEIYRNIEEIYLNLGKEAVFFFL